MNELWKCQGGWPLLTQVVSPQQEMNINLRDCSNFFCRTQLEVAPHESSGLVVKQQQMAGDCIVGIASYRV
jgi:hypothetical protein